MHLVSLLIVIGCYGKEIDTGEPAAAEPPVDTGSDIVPVETGTDYDLATQLHHSIHGYFLYYDEELDAFPNEDGWVCLPTLWGFGADNVPTELQTYVWDDSPEHGGGQIENYSGEFTIDGNILRLMIVAIPGRDAITVALAPSITDDGTVSWTWSLSDGTIGAVSVNPAWQDYPTQQVMTDTGDTGL